MSDSNHNSNSVAENDNLGVDESYYSIKQNESSNMIDKDGFAEALQSKLEKHTSSTSSESEQIQNPPATPGVCRICLQTDSNESYKCISPCFCRGSISMVHKTCLEMWLAQSTSNNCEICKFQFKIKRISKYSLVGSIKAWLFSGERREEIKELKHDIRLLFIAAPAVIILSNSGYFMQTLLPDFDLLGQIVTFAVSLAVMSVDVFFAFWTTCRIQHHITKWFDFYKQNQQVVILDTKVPENSS